jgi:hypothetical protein
MSADFWFGLVIGAILLAVAVAALMIWDSGNGQSHGQRSLALMRERNRLDEDKLAVLKGMNGWIAELVELMKDAKISPSSAGLAAESAAVGSEYVLLGGCADGGEPLSKAEMQEVLDAFARRYGQQAPAVPVDSQPGALFSAVMELEGEREVLP